MKSIKSTILFVLLLSSTCLMGCTDLVLLSLLPSDDDTEEKQKGVIYLPYDELRSSIELVEESTLDNPSKIYLYDDYLLVNDKNKGVHIYDNIRPYRPQHLGLINIPGNLDIELKEGILYADSFIDLVAIDLTNFPEITEVKRIKDIFPYDPYQVTGKDFYFSANPENGVVIDYR